MTNEQKLRALVDAATPGKRMVTPLVSHRGTVEVWQNDERVGDYPIRIAEIVGSLAADAALIAATDPETLRAMLACVEALRALRHFVPHDRKMLYADGETVLVTRELRECESHCRRCTAEQAIATFDALGIKELK